MGMVAGRRGILTAGARLAAFAVLAVPLAGCVGQAYYPPAAPPEAYRRYELSADVLFAFGRADLLPQASAALQDILVSMRQTYPYPHIKVEGHTDSIGNDAANDALSRARAESVRQWLIAAGIPPAAIETQGFGKRQPVAPNVLPNGADNPDGRARNRRVVLVATPA